MAQLGAGRDVFVAALAAGRSVTDAVARAGVSRGTAVRWHAEPEVQARLVEMRRATLAHARTRLLGLVDRAADTLAEVMAGSVTDSARVSAARTVLGQALRLEEAVEVEGRLADLERAADVQEAARKRWSA